MPKGAQKKRCTGGKREDWNEEDIRPEKSADSPKTRTSI